MPHHAVSPGYASVNRLAETAPRNTLMTGNTEESYECRTVSRPRVCDGQAPTVEGVFRQGNQRTAIVAACHTLLVAAGFAGFPGEGSPSGGPS
jgi:hypothetical protein